MALFRHDSRRKRSLVRSSQPASQFKSTSAFADTAFLMRLYSSAAFSSLGPLCLQIRFDKFWFRDKGSPIDPQHSAKIISTISCVPEGKGKFSENTLVPSGVRLVPQNLQ